MRRLDEEELALAPVQRLAAATPERARATAIVDSLRPYLHEELALQDEQVDELSLLLERALLLSLRGSP